MNRVHTGRSMRAGLRSLLLALLLLPAAPLRAQETFEVQDDVGWVDFAMREVEAHVDAASGQLVVTFTVENRGNTVATDNSVALYDPASGSRFGQVAIPPLAPNQPYKRAVAVPDNWRGARHRVAAMVDPDGQVDEPNEKDNAAASNWIGIADVQPPDLTVTAVEPFFDAARGELVISFEMANRGAAPAPDTTVRLYDVETKSPLRDVAIPQLGARQPYGDKAAVRVRKEWRGTSRSFAAVVDPDRKITETNERNNEYISKPLQIGGVRLPDLVVIAVEPQIDKVITVLVTVENQGNVAAPAAAIELRDVASGSRLPLTDISPLDPGKSVQRKAIAQLRDDWRGTTRTFRAHVDPGNRIGEISEDNNRADSKPLPISDRRPDLAMTALEPSLDSAGERLTLYFAVENRSDVAVPATQIDLYDVTTGATLKLVDVRPLAAKEPFEGEITVPVDGTWRGTTRGFAALIEPDEKIAEADENNNEYYSKDIEIVGPQLDLAIVGLELQKEYSPPILLIWIENQGDSDAPETNVEVRDAGGGALSEPVAVPSLAPGSSFTAEATLRIAADWPGGDVMLEAIVDPLNQLVERDKANNRWPASVFISPDGGGSVAANVAIAATVAAGLILAIVWIRRTRSAPELRSRKSDKPASQIWTRVRPDPGVQGIKADSPSITLPALSLRPTCDGGTQRIDFERT